MSKIALNGSIFGVTMLVCVSTLQSGSTLAESNFVVQAEKETGNSRVQVVTYDELYGDLVPEFGDRRWRTVTCVYVTKDDLSQSACVWRRCGPGRLTEGIPLH